MDKVDFMLDYNLITGSPNSVFIVKKDSPTLISINLTYRRAYYIGKDRVWKMEMYTEGIKLKKGAGVTYPYVPYIKGKGYTLPFGKVRSIYSNPREFIYLDI